jgi:serine/threonine protein kinase
MPSDSAHSSEELSLAGLPAPAPLPGPVELESVLDEFTTRLRNGQPASVDDFLRRFPEFAVELKEMLPVVASMEHWKRWREIPGPETEFNIERVRQLGEYAIVREIGRGGMGVVLEAVEKTMNRTVAVKVMLKKIVPDSKWHERFQHEATIVARLHHANIVPVYRYGEERGYCYYVMPLVDGISLSQVIGLLRKEGEVEANSISRRPQTNAPAPALMKESDFLQEALVPSGGRWLRKNAWGPIVRMALQITKAVKYAHSQGVLHRDIKPANILLDTQGTVRVTDFGLAMQIDPTMAYQDVVTAGTLRYMAPEQFTGVMGERCDVYSLGMTLYELCTLQSAFGSNDSKELVRQIRGTTPKFPRQINREIPKRLEQIILKAIRRDPRSRYPSVDALMTDLREFLPAAERLQNVTGLRRWWLRTFGV